MHVFSVTLALLAAVAATAALPHHAHTMPEEMKKMFEGPQNIIKKMCLNSTDISPEMIMTIHEGHFDEVKDNNTMCFMHCVLNGMGMVKEGRPDVMVMEAMMQKMMPPPLAARAKKALDQCKDKVGADACDTALQFFKCTHAVDAEAVAFF